MNLLERAGRSLSIVFAVFLVAVRRLWSGRGLAVAAALGLTVIVGFTLGVPLYADAVYHRVLTTEIGRGAGWRMPAFAFLFRYVSRGHAAPDMDDWTQLQPADRFMTDEAPDAIGLPRRLFVRYFSTDSFPVFPTTGAATYDSERQPLTHLSLGYLSDLEQHATVQGRWPQDQAAPDDPLEVVINERTANKLGLQVGEQYVVFANKVAGYRTPMPVVVTGVWAPGDRNATYWFTDPALLASVLFTTQRNYTGIVAPKMHGETSIATWYMDFDDACVQADNVPELIQRIGAIETRTETLLPGTRLEASPERSLENYQRKSRLLTVQLMAFGTPMLVLLFAFVTLVAGLMVENRRNETAVLRSRGASVWQVVGISAVEATLLALVAMLTGLLLGISVARLIGLTRSFLSFDNPTGLAVQVTPAALRLGALSVVIAVLVIVLPVFGAARYTIITYKQQRARNLRPPWWQRAWLDVLLLIPAAYGTYLLRQQGTIVLPVSLGATSEDPFGNPLLFLVPAFAMVAVTLLLLRLMPFVLRLLAWLLARTPGVSLVLATRQLARMPGFYATPLLLLVLTLSLATFTASLAATLDQHMLDRIRYRIGSDLSIVEAELTGSPADMAALADRSNEADSAPPEQPERGSILISDYAAIDGVADATGVGSYKATARFGGQNVTGQLVGVDRVGFSRVAFWRRDFADRSLGTLMNLLAGSSDSVLLPETVMNAQGLSVGDTVRITVSTQDETANIPFRVAGSFRLWPGWYPDPENPRVKSLFAGNLDYISEAFGMQLPYRIVMKLEPGASPSKVIARVDELGVSILRADYTDELIDSEQARPERQGLFGVLSVGFAAAALFTVLGFFLHIVFSLRRRYIELGVLAAIGVGKPQIAALLAWEMFLLLGIGAAAGTLLGSAASQIYIPFLQVGVSADARTVPFRIILPWPALYSIYALFAGMFAVALVALVIFAYRMRVFEAVKLGETE
jgi:putative ABC transport system permease protein